jgi:hypothetical protein
MAIPSSHPRAPKGMLRQDWAPEGHVSEFFLANPLSAWVGWPSLLGRTMGRLGSLLTFWNSPSPPEACEEVAQLVERAKRLSLRQVAFHPAPGENSEELHRDQDLRREQWLVDVGQLRIEDQLRVIAGLWSSSEVVERGMVGLREAARSQVDLRLERHLSAKAGLLTWVAIGVAVVQVAIAIWKT